MNHWCSPPKFASNELSPIILDYPQLSHYSAFSFCSSLTADLSMEQEKYKTICDELERAFNELSGY